MSLWESHKKVEDAESVNVSARDWAEEEKSFPLILDGMLTAVSDRDTKGVISVQLYIDQGVPMARVMDRREGTQVFIELEGLKDALTEIEAVIKTRALVWKPISRHSRNGIGAR